MSDGEQRGDGGIVTRRSGRHAAAAAGPGASVAGLRGHIVSALAWLFERRLHLLVVAVSIATVAMISGAVVLFASTNESGGDGSFATAVDTERPTPTDPGAPSTSAPILPSPTPPSSIRPTNPPPRAEGGPADPATDAPVEPPAEQVTTEPPGAGTTPAEPNQAGGAAEPEPDTPEEPGTPAETGDPDEPDPTEDCDEHDLLLMLLLGPRCP